MAAARQRPAVSARLLPIPPGGTVVPAPAARQELCQPRPPSLASTSRARPRMAPILRVDSDSDSDSDDEGESEDQVCLVCSRSDDAPSMLLCSSSGCSAPYHYYCLKPPLPRIPDGDWWCPTCTSLRRTDPLFVDRAVVEINWEGYGWVVGEVVGIQSSRGDSSSGQLPGPSASASTTATCPRAH